MALAVNAIVALTLFLYRLERTNEQKLEKELQSAS